jgi:hypothetical protein
LALVNANYCFISIDAGTLGKSRDSSGFKNLDIGRKLDSKQLGIPGSRLLSNDDDGKCMSFVVVADKVFSLSNIYTRKGI